jgi:putative aldouronate transport system substrate-binding protein
MKRSILLFLCVLLTGIPVFAGGGKDSSAGGAPVELVWYTGGLGPQPDMAAVLAEVNKYTREKINCTIRIVESDFGSFPQRMQMIIASQEPFDICFTSSWCNDYIGNVNKNAYLELDELLPKYAPDLYKLIPQAGWDAVKVNGHIYGVPNYQIWARATPFICEKQYIDKYGISLNSVKSYEDVESLMAGIKRDYPGMYPFYAELHDIPVILGLDTLIGGNIPGAIAMTDGSLKVINQYELPEFQNIYRRMRDWYQKGYIKPDMAVIPDNYQDVIDGNMPIALNGAMKPGMEGEETIKRSGRATVAAPFSEAWLTTGGIIATMNAVSRSSRHPEKAMEFLNLLNTDKYLYNLIILGIEGKHYKKIDPNYVEPIANSGFGISCDWMYGNQFLAYFRPGQNTTDWDETVRINTTAKVSPALGFSFDPTPVQTEIAMVSAVVTEYHKPLVCGAVDPDRVLPEFTQKLKDAGSEKLVAELQRQLNAWKGTR